MSTVGLVACGKRKQPTAAPAQDLYTGSLFRKASAYARATYDQWFILSAKHGLLLPAQWIEPYDLSLRDLPRNQRQAWAESVLDELETLGLSEAIYCLHAGDLYSEFLVSRLDVERPLVGLGIGKQLAWYRARKF